jgi:hypothetical protein
MRFILKRKKQKKKVNQEGHFKMKSYPAVTSSRVFSAVTAGEALVVCEELRVGGVLRRFLRG